ncbi:G-protein coupled receptor 1-like protein 2 [Colletotrichum chlorophyti]|uniref:G-protein coupled receptor 1-like protein 2 n=1 Tax=Colletotrichum chlorophyti TaxID=708187 RepID=A0A1Q8S3A5_9PEZI|nr:G-protein coupled receptor 1-like protein 2 [Colletotrichum chlorophyti]
MAFRKDDEALAAPTIPAEVRLQSTIILIVAVLSFLGAAWIMVSYAIFPNLRSFRHRLIHGLAISDCCMAFNFLCSTSMNVDGKFIGHPQRAPFCTLNGFMTQVFVIQTDYWVLTIAICTYFILAGHKKQSSWIQDHEGIILALPWVFSVLWASVGVGVVGYGDIGAWCWFTSDKVRLLVNFIPRWVIIVTMFALYAYLSYVLYTAHVRLSSLQEASPRQHVVGHTPLQWSRVSSHLEDAEGRSAVTIQRLKKVIARLMLLYPLVYAVIWSLPTAIRIYQATKDKPAPFALQTIDKASIVIQGLVDAVIYGVNETSLASWRARLSRREYPTIRGVDIRRVHTSPAVLSGYQSPRRSGRRELSSTTSNSTEPERPVRDDEASNKIELRDLRA